MLICDPIMPRVDSWGVNGNPTSTYGQDPYSYVIPIAIGFLSHS